MNKKPKLVLVDDHLLFRQSLKCIITKENIGIVIGEVSNGIEFIKLLSQLKPDLVLMDINMPKMNGIEATQKALELFPDLKIIAYSMFGEEEYFSKMIAMGVKGFIVKSSSIDELEKAIGEVMKGKTYFSTQLKGKISQSFGSGSDLRPTIKASDVDKQILFNNES